MWQTIFSIVAALGLSALLARQFLDALARQKAEPIGLFGEILPLLANARLDDPRTAGVHRLIGDYQGLPVQVQTVVDTLAVRKLPSLWLMVTIPVPLPVTAIFDLMMRPSGPTSFSNFDHLPETVERPADFPEHAVIRTDDSTHMVPAHVVRPHLAPFFDTRAKELLISPKGIRMVVQIGEGDRARYGVFRQASFAGARVEAETLRDVLDRLIAIRQDIETWHRTTS
ncbi:MAG: hypothetical protein KDK89_17165 [Alphaproteobacteria bacterium]|nr:hypothetical protein [Alphaproteobacteria bacterium]